MEEKIELALVVYENCLANWIDLPKYVYTEKYKAAFIEFIKPRLERENINIENLVLMTLDHETGNKMPYFEFDRESKEEY